MDKALAAAFGCSMIFYVATGLSGYLALGDAAPPNVLTAFGGEGSGGGGAGAAWLPLLANAMVLVHLVPAYQVVAQPLFVILERLLLRCAPRLASLPDALVRAAYRCVFVGVTTLIAAVLPFFASIAGLIGAAAAGGGGRPWGGGEGRGRCLSLVCGPAFPPRRSHLVLARCVAAGSLLTAAQQTRHQNPPPQTNNKPKKTR